MCDSPYHRIDYCAHAYLYGLELKYHTIFECVCLCPFPLQHHIYDPLTLVHYPQLVFCVPSVTLFRANNNKVGTRVWCCFCVAIHTYTIYTNWRTSHESKLNKEDVLMCTYKDEHTLHKLIRKSGGRRKETLHGINDFGAPETRKNYDSLVVFCSVCIVLSREYGNFFVY